MIPATGKSGLPSGWDSAWDAASGAYYYYEAGTGRVQWERPGGSGSKVCGWLLNPFLDFRNRLHLFFKTKHSVAGIVPLMLHCRLLPPRHPVPPLLNISGLCLNCALAHHLLLVQCLLAVLCSFERQMNLLDACRERCSLLHVQAG